MSSGDYKPDIGSNVPRPGDQYTVDPSLDTYADIDELNSDLQRLMDRVNEFILTLEEDLANYDLVIYPDADPRLLESHIIEWPSSLGSRSEAISYSYYKSLRLRNTASASYIRKRYEEAVRDVGGTVSLDLLILVQIVRNEIFLIQDFIASSIQDVDDTSEFRIIEAFQDWVQSSFGYESTLRALFREREKRVIPATEIQRTTATEAREGQAVSKAKLNSYNNLLTQEIESLRRSFESFSEAFFKKSLAPAMRYRLKVGRKPNPNVTELDSEVAYTSNVLSESIRLALADETRRRSTFESKLQNSIRYIAGQSRARNTIRELSVKGKPLPSEGTRIVSKTGLSDAYSHDDFAKSISTDSSGPSLDSLHSALGSLEANDHPQYLLRAGGMITGNVELSEDGSIDGVIPSKHRHTGLDGSPQINGADIIGGTLSEDAVDPERKPPRPEELTFIKYTGSANSGLIDASMSWYGDSRYTYEIQVARIEDEDNGDE